MRNIIFEKVILNNFKNHEHIDFNFTPNRFVTIFGRNGAGKSALISDSICYALYDTTPKGVRGDDVIRKKSEKDCYVSVEFSIDKDKYVITNYRKHKEFGDKKLIFKNGNEITRTSRKETNTLIEQLILPYDIFCNCLLFSQYINKSFISLTHAGQKEILDRMLSLDKYDTLQEKVIEGIKKTELEKSSTESRISEISFYKKKQLNNLRLVIRSKVSLRKDFDNNILIISKQIDELWRKTSSYPNVKSEFDRVSEIGNTTNSRIIEIKNTLKSEKTLYEEEYKSIETNSSNKFSIEVLKIQNQDEKFLRTLQEETETLTKKEYNIKNKLNNKRNEILLKAHEYENTIRDVFNSKNEKTTIDINDRTCKKNRLEEQYKSNIKELNDCDKKIKDIDNSLNQKNPICPTCMQEIDSEHKCNIIGIKNKLHISITQLNKDSKIISENILKLNEEITSLRNENNKIIEEKNNNLELLNIEKDKKLKEIEDSFNNDLKQISEEINSLLWKQEENRNKIKKETDDIIQNINTEKEKLFSELKEKYRNRGISLYNEGNKLEIEYKEILKQIEKLEDELRELERNKQSLKEKEIEKTNITKVFYRNYKEYESSINKIKDDIRQLLKQSKDDIESLKRLEEKINILKFWKDAFGNTGIKSILLDESIPILNSISRELSSLTENIKVNFSSQSTLKSGEFRDKFQISALNTRNLSSLEELSAGETKMVNIIVLLCLRGLLEKMSSTKINILLLDEILDSLDPDNSQIAINMMKKLSNDNCVILISHTLRDYIEPDEELSL